MALAYQATYRDKRGCIRDYAFGETPADAAREVFARNPKAERVMCCDAFFDELSGNRWRGNGQNIHWLGRHEVTL